MTNKISYFFLFDCMSNDWLTIVGIQMSDNGTDREKIAALKTSLNDITEKVVCTMYIAQYI